jgi:hypothetical protein
MPPELNDEQKQELAERLRLVPMFMHLRDGDLLNLAEIGQTEAYPSGSELFRQSDVDSALYVILDGQVSLFHVDPAGVESFVGFRESGPEGNLGEASVLLSDAHDVTAIANTQVTVLEIERKALDELMATDPGLRGRLEPRQETADRMKAPHFGWQAADESVVKFVREHPWALIRRMFIPVGLLAGLIVAAVVFSDLLRLSLLADIVTLLAGLVFIGMAIFVFIDWSVDYYVVTNKRVVHIDQVPLIRQKKEEAPLSAIQEIQFARNSIIAHLLNFGDLRVETFAGSVAMKDIPEPEEVKSFIFREIEKVRSRARAAARKTIRDELNRRVGHKGAPPPASVSTSPQEEQRATSLLSVLAGALRYFFPKLREESGETIIYRKHWVALFRKTRVPFIGVILTLVGTLLWWQGVPPLGLLPDAFWLMWLVLLLAFGGWSLWLFEDWRNDLYIVTPTRVIDLQRVPFLLQETRKESGLDKVQTMEVKILTPWARLFNYGNVIVRVPGAVYEFNDVQHPARVQDEISKRVDQFKRRQAETEARGRQTELSDWFAMYDQIRTGYRAPVVDSDSSEQK